jgi:hypothetical protein
VSERSARASLQTQLADAQRKSESDATRIKAWRGVWC